MKKKHGSVLAIFSGFLILALTGCGPSQGELGGTVSYKGKPVVRGSVLVVGPDGVPKQGPINANGSYLVKEISTGTVKIAVSSPEPMAKAGRKKNEPPEKVDHAGWFRIPENYSDPEKSMLTFQLKPGSNSHAIELK